MRIPYIDGQTGVAQKHYDNERKERERMPGRSGGQVYTYPQVSHKQEQEQHIIVLPYGGSSNIKSMIFHCPVMPCKKLHNVHSLYLFL